MGNLVIFLKTEVAPNWRWRDRFGQFHNVSDMETRHLFFTLRMIWNNRMPAHARVGNVRLYSFQPFYTDKYMGDAIVHCGRELAKRKNLTAQMKYELGEMAKYFTMRLEEGHRLLENRS